MVNSFMYVISNEMREFIWTKQKEKEQGRLPNHYPNQQLTNSLNQFFKS
ncbi:protein of unknown function [Bacillus velezensis UCMB5033]|nr:protein of unknown function [Bacillus velezensis UCMB5033]